MRKIRYKISSDKRKNEKWKIIALIFVLLVAFFLRDIVNIGMGVVNNLLFPIQRKIYEVGNFIDDSKDVATNYKKILEENKKLKDENIKYNLILTQNKILEEENDRLREILELKSESKYEIKVAKVNFRTPTNLYEKFFIDLGTENGIKKDMLVFSQDILVGKISKVYNDYSLVEMITGENFSISAITESGMLGILKGSDEGDGSLYFEPNSFQGELTVGEEIYTSGISDIYPKGIFLGKISEFDNQEGELFRSIKVKNDMDIVDLKEVLIMLPKERKDRK